MRNIAQTAFLMAILTLVSKLLGFTREIVMANYFGASYITDAYVMALTIPGIIFMGFFGAVDTAYMPLFSKTIENHGEVEGNKFTSDSINLALIVALISGLMGVLFSDQIVRIFASGFTGEKALLTSYFLKITFSYAIFTSASGILEAFLKYKGIFLSPIIAGYLPNFIIIVIIIISAHYNPKLLVWGWFLGYLFRLLIMWCLSRKKNFKYTINTKINGSAKKIMTLSLPVFVGSYINQTNVFVDKTLASRLPVGSVAALNYGYLLMGIITGLTITIIITIIYPKLNQAHSLQNYSHFNDMISTGFVIIFLIAVPCSLGAMLYSEQIVQIVYERGAFDMAATALTRSAFFYYSAGILFTSLNLFLTQIYYSLHDMKSPVIYGAIGVIINIILNLVLIGPMAHSGLALSTSIAAMLNAVLLYFNLKRKYPYIIIIKSKGKIFKILMASAVTILSSWIIYTLAVNMIGISRTVSLFLSIAVAAAVYLLLLIILKIEELTYLKQLIRK